MDQQAGGQCGQREWARTAEEGEQRTEGRPGAPGSNGGFWFDSKGCVRTVEGFVGKGLANIFRGTPYWWG